MPASQRPFTQGQTYPARLVSRNNGRTDMQQAEIYNGHARRFQQMARHIELSMTPQHQQKHGGPDPISTNDITLATTLLNSVYGYRSEEHTSELQSLRHLV